jgi:hypothetical protein
MVANTVFGFGLAHVVLGALTLFNIVVINNRVGLLRLDAKINQPLSF